MHIEQAQKALATLGEALGLEKTVITRDATIQRFEYTFEAVWKLLKRFLDAHEGIACNSPKACFREAFKTGIFTETDAESALVMTDDRNLTAHTYIEAVATLIYKRIPGHYTLMRTIADEITNRLK